MHMPFMNGIELAKNIRQSNFHKKIKIVLITADEMSNNEFIDLIVEKPAPVSKIKEIY